MRSSAILLLGVLAAGVSLPVMARCPDTPPFVSDATIRFEPGSTALGPSGMQEVHEMAARAKIRRGSQICVYGAAARREEGGEALALDRAETVAEALRDAGIPMFQIDAIPISGGDGLLGGMSGEGRVEIVLEP